MSSYLTQGIPSDASKEPTGVTALKLWLIYHITTPNYVASGVQSRKFGLKQLQDALFIGLNELALRLDPQIQDIAFSAKNVEVSFDDIFHGRDGELRSLMVLDDKTRTAVVEGYTIDECALALETLRSELGWMKNEVGRLDLHVKNAAEGRASGRRGKFVFRALPREFGSVDEGFEERDMKDEDGEGMEEKEQRLRRERLAEFHRDVAEERMNEDERSKQAQLDEEERSRQAQLDELGKQVEEGTTTFGVVQRGQTPSGMTREEEQEAIERLRAFNEDA